MNRRRISLTRAAFTLIELLVVILIIAIVIAIVVPSLGKVRRSAKVTVTRGLMSQVASAASAFQNDMKRIPGYYSAKDMGSKENGDTRGMSGMHNAILDLVGGPTFVGFKNSDRGARPLSPWAQLGPRRDETGWINPSTMGSGSSNGQAAKAYFVPPPKHFILPRPNRGTEVARFGDLDKNITDESKLMPDLVDAFGTPMLWWGEDETVNGPFVKTATATKPQFIQAYSGPTTPAKFYWASNAAYLNATSLGKNRADQTKQTGANKQYSMIGGTASSGGTPPTTAIESLGGLLASPAFADGLSTATSGDQVLPSGVRGKFVIHAANPDGYFLDTTDRGAKNVAGTGGKILKFSYNFFQSDNSTRRLDDKGKPTSVDIVKDFEDLIQTGGN